MISVHMLTVKPQILCAFTPSSTIPLFPKTGMTCFYLKLSFSKEQCLLIILLMCFFMQQKKSQQPAQTCHLNGKWTVFIQCLCSLFDYLKRFTTQVSIHTFAHIHLLRAGDFSTTSQPAHQELIHTHSLTSGAAIGIKIQYLAQGHFGMQTRGARDRTTDLLIGRRPALPTEPQLPIYAISTYTWLT